MESNKNTRLEPGDLVKVHIYRFDYIQSVFWHDNPFTQKIGLARWENKTQGIILYVPYKSIAIVIEDLGIRGFVIFWDQTYLRSPEFLLEKMI
jgi:hypothetical protein